MSSPVVDGPPTRTTCDWVDDQSQCLCRDDPYQSCRHVCCSDTDEGYTCCYCDDQPCPCVGIALNEARAIAIQEGTPG